jgi:hypothetical protein
MIGFGMKYFQITVQVFMVFDPGIIISYGSSI